MSAIWPATVVADDIACEGVGGASLRTTVATAVGEEALESRRMKVPAKESAEGAGQTLTALDCLAN
jgi:hypothetical protein